MKLPSGSTNLTATKRARLLSLREKHGKALKKEMRLEYQVAAMLVEPAPDGSIFIEDFILEFLHGVTTPEEAWNAARKSE